MEVVQQNIDVVLNKCAVMDVPIDSIKTEEAKESTYSGIYKSLKENVEILQPVRLMDNADGSYMVIVGSRRVLAAKKAGKETIQAVVHLTKLTEQEIALQRVIENMNRSPNPAMEAESLNILIASYDWNAADAAKKLGIPVSHIRRRLKLLQLIPEFFEKLKKGEIKLTVAWRLSSLPKELQRELLEEEKLTLDRVESAARESKLNTLPDELFELSDVQADSIEDLKFRIKDLISKTADGSKEKLEKALSILED
ncbi:MAG: ParB/RepB/Spo0J family partition protein [Nitrospirae bacterium]|nr:ParB/RepB/Spo0J family partition protein [Nitrospirota bacterium]